MVRAWLLINEGEKKILEADGCDTVESLKKRFAPHFGCEHSELEAMLLAKRLPDSAVLTAEGGFDEKAIVTLLKRRSPVTSSSCEPPSKEEMENDVSAFRKVLFTDDGINRQKVYELRKLTSNVSFVNEMVASIPSLNDDPIVRNIIHDWPLLLRWTSNPEVYKVAECHPAFSKVLAYLTNALKQRSSSADGLLSDVRSQIHFERMVLGSDSDTDVSSDDNNPTSTQTAAQSRNFPLTPEFAAALSMMMPGQGSSSQTNSRPTEPARSSTNHQRPLLTTQMLAEAIQSSTNFGQELQQSLNRFHEMGFTDDEENKRVLAECNYDFDRALETIIQRREANDNFS
uniref:UBA domain-containing protein n=1 Tax=Trichuris muris TaxID=70415 RepID=A0A5S6QYW7_TRIMR